MEEEEQVNEDAGSDTPEEEATEEVRDVEIEEQAQAQAFDCCGLEIPVR